MGGLYCRCTLVVLYSPCTLCTLGLVRFLVSGNRLLATMLAVAAGFCFSLLLFFLEYGPKLTVRSGETLKTEF